MTKEQYWRSIYIISDIWKNTGWSSIIYLAALSGVDPQLHEAAHIDGASRVQRIWHINVPGIIPTAVLLFIMSCGQIMSVGFEKVYLLQNSLNLSVSEVISTYVYKTGLLGAKFSYTSAIGLFNSLINVTLLLIVNKISSKVSGIMLF
jgi:putative aldouronate transport system permease protein